jgi:hypothetical protein
MRTASELADLIPRDVVHIQGVAPRIGGRYEDGLGLADLNPRDVVHIQGIASWIRGRHEDSLGVGGPKS